MATDLTKDNKFEDLEKICLLLDIIIDCEEYNTFDTKLLKMKENFSNLLPNFDKEYDKKNKQQEIIKTIEQNIKELSNIDSVDDVKYFKNILTSKYVRRLIKDKEKTLETQKVKNLFKALTEELLKIIPQKSEEKSEPYNRKNQLRIIFLNEISACSEGHLSIGYADMALEELRELNKRWNLKGPEEKRIKHPYELYALYNMGLTYLHNHREADKAIETLLQVTSLFEKAANNENNKNFQDEYKEIQDVSKLYPIYFWLVYAPSKYLIAEAYSDSYSSFNLEESVKKVIETIREKENEVKLRKIFTGSEDNNLTHEIKSYFQHKFGIQLVFSAIDKRNERVFKDCEYTENDWLNYFKPILIDNKIEINRTYVEKHPIIKNRIEAAEALFYLELARTFKDPSKTHISKAFEICAKHLKEDSGSDWSGFAYTFLEGAIFELENDNHKLPNNFEDSYKRIFKNINDEDWISRKKDLVKKFLTCQEKLLLRYEKQPNLYLQCQLELVKNILSKDSGRRFQKKWPECEKEKLVKNLKYIIESVGMTTDESKNKDIIDTLGKDTYKLPEDVSPVAEFIQGSMNCDYYTKKLRLNTEEFNDHLIYQSCRPSLKDCYGLTVLRRWQSFTPALSMGSEVGHKGGGYFVYKTDKKGEIVEGLVIDPGFDFLENFFDEGFSIRDIKAVLITHSHRDHCSDFMSIVTLVHEMNKRGKRVFRDGKWEEKKLILFITEGCHQNFVEQIMRQKETFHDVIRVQQGTKYSEKIRFLKHFQLEVTKANHYDQSDHDSVGYIIKDGNKNPKCLIGFTGDTQWYNKIEENYKECPVICMNIGGVVDIFKEDKITALSDLCNKEDKKHNNIKTILLKENHLYLPGFYLMAKKLNKNNHKLLILSELCEEMKGGLRTDLAEKVSKELKIPVIPEDIGLTVKLSQNKKGYVLCQICNAVKTPKEIVSVETDKDNAIMYLCKDHYKQLKEGYILPKINELELDVNELRKPLIT